MIIFRVFSRTFSFTGSPATDLPRCHTGVDGGLGPQAALAGAELLAAARLGKGGGGIASPSACVVCVRLFDVHEKPRAKNPKPMLG